MEKLNFRTYHKEYIPYFRDITGEKPELKTIEQLENIEVWKTASTIEKTFLLATFLDWIGDGLINSPTTFDELNEVYEYLSGQMDEQNQRVEKVHQIDEKLQELPTKQAKLNFLNSLLLEYEMFKGQFPDQDKDNRDIIQYLTSTINYWEKHNNDPTAGDQVTGKPFEKIKWKGKPSQFAFLFLELVKHGFIEPPFHRGESNNYTGLSRLCYQYFDIDTTPENLTKELKPDNEKTGTRKNTLSDTNRAKFTIPNLSDLA